MSKSLSLCVISNKSGLLIQSICNGIPVRASLCVIKLNSTGSPAQRDPFRCIIILLQFGSMGISTFLIHIIFIPLDCGELFVVPSSVWRW